MTSKTLVPKISACTLALVAAGFGLTACGSSQSGSAASDAVSPAADASVSAPSSSATGAAATDASARTDQGTKTAAQGADVSCTNQINYAGDPRSNAEINSIGATTGTCPAVEKPASSSGRKAMPSVRSCRTKDLKLTVAEESQAGGYYLVTASARPGVACTLKGITASAAFGSSPDSAAGPAEQSTSASIRLSGTTKAYAGVSPKTTADNNGVEYPQIILSASASDPDPISITLAKPVLVDQPVATNWHSSAADAVPVGGGTDQ